MYVQDELLWAAAWIYHATNEETYLNYLGATGNTGGTRTAFSWDDKYVGAQILVSKVTSSISLLVPFTNIYTIYLHAVSAFN